MDRMNSMFLQQFNGIYSKFNFVDKNVLYFLFKTHVMSFYGVELWHESLVSPSRFHRASVTYHKAVKKMSGYNVWHSYHEACDVVGVPIFRHLVATRVLGYYISLCRSRSPCIALLKYYFRFASI